MMAFWNNIPLSFDPEFYRLDKPFLSSNEEALKHFVMIGRKAGLKGSPGCDHGYLLRNIKGADQKSILEIGPGCSPKFLGCGVYYFDVKTKEDLENRYQGTANYNTLPDMIHYVDEDGDLNSVAMTFDVVFSSHVIEHMPDLIKHINDVAALLNDGGAYLVVVPDKRYTFDHFKPLTTWEDVICRHYQAFDDNKFSLKSLFLEKTMRTHNDPARHWRGDNGSVPHRKESVSNIIAEYEKIKINSVARSGYHNWFFSDESFSEVVNVLYCEGICELKVYQIYNTPFGSMSFAAVLGR